MSTTQDDTIPKSDCDGDKSNLAQEEEKIKTQPKKEEKKKKPLAKDAIRYFTFRINCKCTPGDAVYIESTHPKLGAFKDHCRMDCIDGENWILTIIFDGQEEFNLQYKYAISKDDYSESNEFHPEVSYRNITNIELDKKGIFYEVDDTWNFPEKHILQRVPDPSSVEHTEYSEMVNSLFTSTERGKITLKFIYKAIIGTVVTPEFYSNTHLDETIKLKKITKYKFFFERSLLIKKHIDNLKVYGVLKYKNLKTLTFTEMTPWSYELLLATSQLMIAKNLADFHRMVCTGPLHRFYLKLFKEEHFRPMIEAMLNDTFSHQKSGSDKNYLNFVATSAFTLSAELAIILKLLGGDKKVSPMMLTDKLIKISSSLVYFAECSQGKKKIQTVHKTKNANLKVALDKIEQIVKQDSLQSIFETYHMFDQEYDNEKQMYEHKILDKKDLENELIQMIIPDEIVVCEGMSVSFGIAGLTLFEGVIAVTSSFIREKVDPEVSQAQLLWVILHELAHKKRLIVSAKHKYFNGTPEKHKTKEDPEEYDSIGEAGCYLEIKICGQAMGRFLDKFTKDAAVQILEAKNWLNELPLGATPIAKVVSDFKEFVRIQEAEDKKAIVVDTEFQESTEVSEETIKTLLVSESLTPINEAFLEKNEMHCGREYLHYLDLIESGSDYSMSDYGEEDGDH
jgi:hypothetical protein